MPIKELNKTKLCCGESALLDGLVNFITEEENPMFILFLFFSNLSRKPNKAIIVDRLFLKFRTRPKIGL